MPRSVLVEGVLSDADLSSLFAQADVELQAATAYAFGTTRVSILVGRRFYFRSNDYLGVAIVAANDGHVQRIDVSYAGGGSGLLGLQWGAGEKLELSIYEGLTNRLRALSLGWTDVPPVGPADRPLPSSKAGPGGPT